MTDPEQVSVNVADLRTLQAFLDSPSWEIWTATDEAFGRLTSAIPEPEWEPTDDMVEKMVRVLMGPPIDAEIHHGAVEHLRALHREGLL